MYKEYRLKQWSMLLDKAATLRRLLESESGHLDTDDSRNETGENHEDRNDVQAADNVPAPRDLIDPSNLQQNWQMAAPEAYHWYPVTDYQNRLDTSSGGNQMISPRTGSQTSSPRVRNPMTSYDSSVQHQQVSTGDNYLCRPPLQRDSVRTEQPPTSVADYNSNLIHQTGLTHHTSQARPYPLQTVQYPIVPAMMTLRDTLDMDSLHTVVEEMEASFHEIEEMMTDQFTSAFNNELVDSYHQVEASAMVLPPLMSPLPDVNHSNRNLQQSFETPHASNTIHQMIMTSSPSAGVRVLDNMSQSTLLGAMGANPTARTRLLWRDDPPNPADNPPRILSRGTARDREETERSEVNTSVSQSVNITYAGPVSTHVPQPVYTTDNGPVNTHVPQPIYTTDNGPVNTCVPQPVYTSDNGPVNTFVPQPVYTTDNGPVNTCVPQPVYTTDNGPVNTCVPQPVYTTDNGPVNTCVPQPIYTTDNGPVNTCVPQPVYTTDNGPFNTYVPQPVYTTDNGPVNTYVPQPVYTTDNGPVNTYVPQPVYTTNSVPVNTTVSHHVFTTDSRPVNPTERDLFNTVNRGPVNNELRPTIPQRSGNPDQMEADADASFQSYVSWDSSLDPDDIDSLPGILFAAERLGPMDQTVHMDIEMGDFGIGHLLFDMAAGTWATSHCEFHRAD